MQQQRGFTLIELIIVIVILGILAVTAAPKFIDIQSDAKASTLNGLKAALVGGSQLVYAKSAIEGEQNNASATDNTSRVSVGGQTVETDFGYPDGETVSTGNLGGWLNYSTNEFTLTVGAGDTSSAAVGSFTLHPVGQATLDLDSISSNGNSCHVTYRESTGVNDAPDVFVVQGGC